MAGKLTAVFKRLTSNTVFRYLLTGGTLFLIDFAVFVGFKSLGVATPVAQVISRTTGAAVGFVGHKLFTFGNRDRSATTMAVQGTGYIGVTIFTILFSPLVVGFFAHVIPSDMRVLEAVPYVSATGLYWMIVKVPSEVIMLVITYILLNLIFMKRHYKS